MKLATILVALAALFAASLVEARREYVLSMQRCDASAPWTLHGLWPEWGMNCPGEKFNVNTLAPIRPQLEVDWLSCPGHSSDNIKFWTHEWTKHGTCSGLGFFNYFNVSLTLLDIYRPACADMIEVEVAPGYTYPVPNKECRICLTEDLEPCSRF